MSNNSRPATLSPRIPLHIRVLKEHLEDGQKSIVCRSRGGFESLAFPYRTDRSLAATDNTA